MKVTQGVIKLEFEHQELKTLANVCELARRFMATRENSGYIFEFGDEEACNIRDFIQRVSDISRQFP